MKMENKVHSSDDDNDDIKSNDSSMKKHKWCKMLCEIGGQWKLMYSYQ